MRLRSLLEVRMPEVASPLVLAAGRHTWASDSNKHELNTPRQLKSIPNFEQKTTTLSIGNVLVSMQNDLLGSSLLNCWSILSYIDLRIVRSLDRIWFRLYHQCLSGFHVLGGHNP